MSITGSLEQVQYPENQTVISKIQIVPRKYGFNDTVRRSDTA